MYWNPAGILIGVANIVVFSFMLIYVAVFKREKDVSHYLFLMVVQSFIFYSIFDLATYLADEKWAIILFNITPIFLGLSIYFYTIFTLYLHYGFKSEGMVLLLFPFVFVVGAGFGNLITGVVKEPYGWIPQYNFTYLALYIIFYFSYVSFGTWNLWMVYKNLSGDNKSRAFKFFLGSLVMVILGIFYVIAIIFDFYKFPLLDLSILCYGILHAWSLTKRS